jgi:AraC-like DNA-binding protein
MKFTHVSLARRQSRSYFAHAHDEYEFHFIFNGGCSFVRGSRRCAAPDGSFIYFSPREVHHIELERDDQTVSQFKLRASLEAGDDALRSLLEERVPGKCVYIGSSHRLFFEQWRHRNESPDADEAAAAHYEMLAFFHTLPRLAALAQRPARRRGRAAGAARERSSESIMERALERIHGAIYGTLDYEALVRESGYSDSYFVRRFRAFTGLPPKQYYLRLKVETAQVLLHETDALIADISDQLCFTDPFYFSKTFKRWTGSAPSAFRVDQDQRYELT